MFAQHKISNLSGLFLALGILATTPGCMGGVGVSLSRNEGALGNPQMVVDGQEMDKIVNNFNISSTQGPVPFEVRGGNGGNITGYASRIDDAFVAAGQVAMGAQRLKVMIGGIRPSSVKCKLYTDGYYCSVD